VAAGVVLCIVCGGRVAVADVQPVVQQGVPRLPIPTFEETRLPDFIMPVDTATFPDGTPAPEAVNFSPGGTGGLGPGAWPRAGISLLGSSWLVTSASRWFKPLTPRWA